MDRSKFIDGIGALALEDYRVFFFTDTPFTRAPAGATSPGIKVFGYDMVSVNFY